MEIEELLDEKIAKFQNIENHSGYDSTQSSFDQGESAGSSRVAFEAINDLKELKQSLPLKQEITEQQALNKLAERFPMTTDQIVSILEMKVAHIEQEKVEVPQAEQATSEFPEHIIKYLDNCKARNAPIEVVLSDARYYNRDYAYWTEEEIRKITVAYATGEYTVKKEPEWVVAIPGQEAFSGNIVFSSQGVVGDYSCNNETRVIFKGEDKKRAEAVALLIGGEIVPVEEI